MFKQYKNTGIDKMEQKVKIIEFRLYSLYNLIYPIHPSKINSNINL